MKINKNKYSEMLMYGAEVLNARMEEVNALNVFPVPDGDTGSNMNMTFQSGISSIMNVNEDDVSVLAKQFSKGLLMGARGNSGVILSQFFRGIAEGMPSTNEVDVDMLHAAFEKGVERAYGSVIKAVEGTILTVAREMVENTSSDFTSVDLYFEELVKNAKISLDNTPELLPILKEAGVVDSGGAGLLYILEGMLANLKGEEISIKQNFEAFTQTEEHPLDPDDIEFGYCTELLVRLFNDDVDESSIREKLMEFGDSIVAIVDEGVLKVHVHTEQPTNVFEYGKTLGDFIFVKSENMRIQAEEAQAERKQNKSEIGIVAVSSSARLGDLFEKIQNVTIVNGGQTLNPSIEDLAKAIERANADNVILLPNNSNIIMAAEAAKDLVEDVNVEIVKTKHMTQAIECLINFNLDFSFEENVENLNACLEDITNIEVTTAIKDTSIEGVEIKENDYLGIIDGKIKYSIASEEELIKLLLDLALEEDAEVINVLVGEEGNVRFIEELKDGIEDESPFTEVNIYNTNQPVYSYLISYLA